MLPTAADADIAVIVAGAVLKKAMESITVCHFVLVQIILQQRDTLQHDYLIEVRRTK